MAQEREDRPRPSHSAENAPKRSKAPFRAKLETVPKRGGKRRRAIGHQSPAEAPGSDCRRWREGEPSPKRERAPRITGEPHAPFDNLN